MAIGRTRGYAYEASLTKRITRYDGWRAWRLGGTQVALPDILAVNNGKKQMIAVECKTSQSNSITVLAHQIERLQDWTQYLNIYTHWRGMILAFRFHSKARGGLVRKVREYFFYAGPVTDYKCTYDGRIFTRVSGSKGWHQRYWGERITLWDVLDGR